MKKELRNKLWKIAEKYLGDDKAHGLSHIRRVYSAFLEFKKENPPIKKDIMDAIEASVILHDLGRKTKGNHALESVKIIKKLVRKGELADLPDLDLILYAISIHNVGPKIKKDFSDSKFVCASFLIIFDHMDGIGAIAPYRNIELFLDYDIFPDKGKAEFKKIFDRCLKDPESIDTESKKMQRFKKSVLGQMAFNYTVTGRILKRVDSLIKGSLLEKEYRKRRELLREYLIILKKEAENS
jgi:hypothetical protein